MYFAWRDGELVFVGLEFIAIFFLVLGAWFPIFVPRSSWYDPSGHSYDYCILLWGVKEKCCASCSVISFKEAWPSCDGRIEHMETARDCLLATLVLLFVAEVLGVLRMFMRTFVMKSLALLFSVAAIGVGCGVWGSMADAYSRRIGTDWAFDHLTCPGIDHFEGPGWLYRGGMQFSSGFVMIVVSWCFNVVALIVLMLL